MLRGILLMARGRREGMAQFGGTVQAFLASLAPLIAFPLVGALLEALRGDGLLALGQFLAAVCAVLAPPVLSHAVARAFRREEAWLRYATAANWCQWAVMLAALVLLVAASLAMMTGVPARAAGAGFVVGLAAYELWLQWFLARHGLMVGRLRAVLVVVVVNVGTALLAVGPWFLGAWIRAR